MATASNGGVYVPPFATTTAVQTAAATTARATGTSLSFAAIGTLPGGATASGTATAATTAAIVDSTGGVDSDSLLAYFTRPYLDAHTLSIPTWRYPYILWFCIAATLIFWSGLYHLSGASHGGSAFGAIFRKYSIRRFMIGGKTKKADAEGGKKVVRSKVRWASPTFAQMITVAGMIGVALCLSLIGPDYIAPTTCIFGGDCGYQSFYDVKGPPKSTYGSRKRDLPAASWNFLPRDPANDLAPAPPQPASLGYTIQPRPKQKEKRGVNNPNGWAPFNDPLLASSNIDIQANWWTAAARLGLISYAMLPLAVTLALKQWPFNIWATPFLTNYHFDKTAILHRWSGRVIWLFSSGHVAAWLYQLVIDKDPFGRPVLVPVWQWYRFVAGAVAYVLLTILTLFSFKSFRDRHYEVFYWSHVVLVLLLFAACIVHHAPLMWWPIVAAAWWGAERLVRFIVFLWINGFAKGIGLREPRDVSRRTSQQSFSVNAVEKVDGYGENKLGGVRYPPGPYDESVEPLAGQHHYPPSPEVGRPRFGSPAPSYHQSPAPSYGVARTRQLPPPGFASCQLLPGRTVRLVLNTAVPLRWRPGQHIFLSVPAVRLFEAHPYTIVSIDDRAKGVAPVGGAAHSPGSEVVLLIRAQKGFSKALWEYVAKARKEKEDRGAGAQECAKGINLRALVSWPIGSSSRVSWDSYDSLLIICGGTGITFGMTVLEYTCRRMVRKDADDKYKTTRVRFVWILREFAHLSWVAPVLRRCYEMLDSSRLQIDLFVSMDAPRPSRRIRRQQQHMPTDEFAPPSAPFARQQRSNSSQSLDTEMSDVSDGEEDRSTQVSSTFTNMPDYYGDHIDSVTDLVLFEGEDDERTPGEVEMSQQVRAAGKMRRALSRKKSGRPAPVRPQHQQSRSDFSTFGSEQDVSYSSLSGAGGRRIPSQQEQSPYSRADSVFAETGSFADLGFAGVDDHQSEVQSLAGDSSIRQLVGGGSGGKRHSGGVEMRAAEHDFLDVTEEDQEDLEVMAELAKVGYPKLKEILDEEVTRSVGKTMVACCGPTGLNTTVRHLVSDRIDISKVLKGDVRSQVSLTVEDFSSG